MDAADAKVRWELFFVIIEQVRVGGCRRAASLLLSASPRNGIPRTPVRTSMSGHSSWAAQLAASMSTDSEISESDVDQSPLRGYSSSMPSVHVFDPSIRCHFHGHGFSAAISKPRMEN